LCHTGLHNSDFAPKCTIELQDERQSTKQVSYRISKFKPGSSLVGMNDTVIQAGADDAISSLAAVGLHKPQ